MIKNEFLHEEYSGVVEGNTYGDQEYSSHQAVSSSKELFPSLSHERVALIVFHKDHIWSRRVIKGFVAGLTNSLPSEHRPFFDVFSAECNHEYFTTQVMPELVKKKDLYGCVVTVSDTVSTWTSQYLQEHNIVIPQVFVGVHNHHEAGITKTVDGMGEAVSGIVTHPPALEHCVRLLKTIKRDTYSVVIPYDKRFMYPRLLEECEQIKAALRLYGISSKVVPFDTLEDVTEQFSSEIPSADVMWCVHQDSLQVHMKKIVAFCNERNITLFASELASVFQGAALGIGESGSLLGAYAGKVVHSLLTRVKSIESMPVYGLETPSVLRINPKVIGRQGFMLTDEQAALVQEIIPLGWE